MIFSEWLKTEGFKDSEIGEVIKSLINEYETTNSVEVKLAIKFIYSELLKSVPKAGTQRECRKTEALKLLNKITKQASKLSYTEVIKSIANKMGVKDDCIYVYLRELGINRENYKTSIHSIQNLHSIDYYYREKITN